MSAQLDIFLCRVQQTHCSFTSVNQFSFAEESGCFLGPCSLGTIVGHPAWEEEVSEACPPVLLSVQKMCVLLMHGASEEETL